MKSPRSGTTCANTHMSSILPRASPVSHSQLLRQKLKVMLLCRISDRVNRTGESPWVPQASIPCSRAALEQVCDTAEVPQPVHKAVHRQSFAKQRTQMRIELCYISAASSLAKDTILLRSQLIRVTYSLQPSMWKPMRVCLSSYHKEKPRRLLRNFNRIMSNWLHHFRFSTNASFCSTP